jgi:hypothetical protein
MRPNWTDGPVFNARLGDPDILTCQCFSCLMIRVLRPEGNCHGQIKDP